VLQYTTGSKSEGIERNSFVTVRAVDSRANTLTVEVEDGSSVTYDPRRLQGVKVFRDVEREFATGDLEASDLLRALIGVSHVGSGADWQQGARRLVDILIAGSRPLK
jgi:hypothetical protein